MNKVFNVNLGGYPFTIDADAYAHLNQYLDTISNHFRNSEGFEEITSDIEGRMAELFKEHMADRPIVTMKDVKMAIAIMGTPEEFGADPIEDPGYDYEDEAPRGKEKFRIKTGKRLFRNPEDEVVGGVCSGIAAYLGIEDPLWVRLVFALIIFSGGIGIPMYVVLWAILPKAESASDRLAMRGEPINVSNIGKIIEEEMLHFSDTMADLGEELGSKKKARKKKNAQEVPLEEEYLRW
ncbi:MAG: PspC domain-containing protein [Bacteroidota bacterium]